MCKRVEEVMLEKVRKRRAEVVRYVEVKWSDFAIDSRDFESYDGQILKVKRSDFAIWESKNYMWAGTFNMAYF